MSQKPKPKAKKPRRSLPAVDADVVQRHLAAYFYAAYSDCKCEACQLLRPIAREMLERLKKGRGVIETGGG